MRSSGLLLCCLLFLAVLLPPVVLAGDAATLESQRQAYRLAREAAGDRDWATFRRQRAALDDYPLAIYLDYLALTADLTALQPAAATDFLQRSRGSALPNRLLSRYLDTLGRRERWAEFLAVMPREPNSIDLKCYYFRAHWARGDRALARAGAASLWVHGESRPKACDPLFAAWMRAGGLTDEHVWSRLLAAFDARERGLLNYVVSKSSAELRRDAERLRAVYAQPDRLRSLVPAAADTRTADTVARGIAYLARYREREALQAWQAYRREMAFSPEQVQLAESALAWRSLFARSRANLAWLDEALDRLGDDNIVELRLRWAIAEQDWAAVAGALESLSESARGEPTWRYWRARSLAASGQQAEADALLETLAGERDFHGFLAAQRLGREPGLQHRRLEAPASLDASLEPGLARVRELLYHDEVMLAHSEWSALLQSAPAEQLLALGSTASERGWHRMAIEAASQASAWDLLDLRFPLAWRDTFARYGELRGVPGSELMAIARRESAFFPRSRSPVGARGLMQVMPATAAQVARRLGVRHSESALYDVDHNVMLASAYYRELLDRYAGNRVFAMAAYNAGPARVTRWRNGSEAQVPVDVWIESIPFRETRNYVKNVLAYNLIFRRLAGEEGTLLSEQEWRQSY
ncbi:MAG: murein transglycosylase [Haliea sp.]|nr:murein transglycosylase [Haliea sp.]